MKLAPDAWPPVLARLVKGFIALAKSEGIKGNVSIEWSGGGKPTYYLMIRIPVAEVERVTPEE